MTTKVHRIGNSLGVYIPKAIAEQEGLKRGTPISIHRAQAGGVILRPATRKPRTLKELLAGVTRQNLHPLLDWGPDVGKEIVEY